jgi:hypothetical protein
MHWGKNESEKPESPSELLARPTGLLWAIKS